MNKQTIYIYVHIYIYVYIYIYMSIYINTSYISCKVGDRG